MRPQLALRRGQHGHPRAAGLPPLNILQQAFRVRRPNDQEALSWNFYDSAFYAVGGQNQLNFFQAIAGKNLEDTNMTLAGQLSAGNNFIVQAIEVEFIPGMTANETFAAANLPSVIGAPAVAASPNDVWKFRNTGALRFNVLAKAYMEEGPLYKFPSSNVFELTGAQSDSTTLAGAQNVRSLSAFIRGQRYAISPILLDASVAFNVQLVWPSAVMALSSAAKVFVRLCGVLYRDAQ